MSALRKNVAGQYLKFLLINASATPVTGAVLTAKVSVDTGALATGAGTFVEMGSGLYRYNFTQAETNGANIDCLFTSPSAVPVHFELFTTAADPTNAVNGGLSALPAIAAGANGGLPTGNASGQVTVGAYASSATPLQLTSIVEGTLTVLGAFRLILSAVAGKLSGAATTTITIRDTTDNKNRIVAVVDANGNRTAVSYDVT